MSVNLIMYMYVGTFSDVTNHTHFDLDTPAGIPASPVAHLVTTLTALWRSCLRCLYILSSWYCCLETVSKTGSQHLKDVQGEMCMYVCVQHTNFTNVMADTFSYISAPQCSMHYNCSLSCSCFLLRVNQLDFGPDKQYVQLWPSQRQLWTYNYRMVCVKGSYQEYLKRCSTRTSQPLVVLLFLHATFFYLVHVYIWMWLLYL